MLFNENISLQFYKDLIADRISMHKSLVFFNGADFSSSSVFILKAAKNICAFANSGGGDIIYGIEPKRNRAELISPVKNFEKREDWLFHELQSYIDNHIKGLKIKITELESNSKIIHFYIPENNNQPHMFADNKYYKLSKSKPIVLDESEVRTLYGRISICDIEFLGIHNTNGLPTLSNGKYSSMSFYPKILIRNSGNMVEKNYKVEIEFPARLYEESFQPLQSIFIRHEGSYVVFGQKGVYPLFQQEINNIIEAKIAVNKNNIDVFFKEYINITLYFSHGIKKHSLKLSDTLTYNGKRLKKEDFTDFKVLEL